MCSLNKHLLSRYYVPGMGSALGDGRKPSDATPASMQLAGIGADRQERTVRIRGMWVRKRQEVSGGSQVPAGPTPLMLWAGT